MQSAIQSIFWICAAAVAYAYAGYPAIIYLLSRAFGHPPSAPPQGELPTVSLLIVAHNEESVIDERIKNALALDYPVERLEIVIASDGSDDQTVAIASQYAPRVRVLDYPQRRGKAATLNQAMGELHGQIVMLSDANTSIAPSAALRLVRWFGNKNVGAVCGRLVLIDPASGKNVDSLYWRYETFLKKCEGRLGALLGANGAIYAIRRNVFVPIAQQTIVDDFAIPLLAALRNNISIIYDRDATGSEETPSQIRQEFRRRVRIGAGGFQAIGMLWPLLNPKRGWIAFTFLSHKIMRWLCPFFLIGALLTGPVYTWAFLGQLWFYAGASVISYIPSNVRLLRPLRLAPLFAGMNAALLVGFARWLLGRQQGAWERTERQAIPALSLRL